MSASTSTCSAPPAATSTGRRLAASASTSGAALAGRLDDLREPLTAYGLPLGEAFQLRDDLLGVFGDAGVTGKPVGDDLREGKPTALVAIAAERVDAAGRRLLDRLGSPDLADDEVAALQDLLVDVGAVSEVEATIDRLVGEANAALGSVAMAGDAGAALAELAAYVAGRDR